jgi:superfamily II DNA helicase RecQ
MKSYKDLNFLVDFKKTIVYFNTRPDAEQARRYLVQELCLDSNKIAVYHSIKSEKFKANILERFRDSHVLILLATEAVGMGCDINDISRVVQYGMPPSLAALIQRLGRAARDPNLQGVGVTIVPRNPPQGLIKDTVNKGLHAFLYTKTCRRKVLGDIFGNKERGNANTNCCDDCSPEKKSVDIIYTDAEVHQDLEAKAVTKRVPRRTEKEKDFARQAIEKWRADVWERYFSPKSFFFPTPQFVMPDQFLKKLADNHAKVEMADSIESFLAWRPPKHEYMHELTDVLMDVNRTITTMQQEKVHEMFESIIVCAMLINT